MPSNSEVNASLEDKIKNGFDWSGTNGKILLEETITLARAYGSLGYTEKQILQELRENGNIE